jgi:hypothetical protein
MNAVMLPVLVEEQVWQARVPVRDDKVLVRRPGALQGVEQPPRRPAGPLVVQVGQVDRTRVRRPHGRGQGDREAPVERAPGDGQGVQGAEMSGQRSHDPRSELLRPGVGGGPARDGGHHQLATGVCDDPRAGDALLTEPRQPLDLAGELCWIVPLPVQAVSLPHLGAGLSYVDLPPVRRRRRSGPGLVRMSHVRASSSLVEACMVAGC